MWKKESKIKKNLKTNPRKIRNKNNNNNRKFKILRKTISSN